MPLVELQVVSVGGKVPRIAMNVNDADYSEKSKNPANYYPAVLVALPGQTVTPVIVSEEDARTIKIGDMVTVGMPDRVSEFYGAVPRR